jgi:hypothetical protein
VESASSRFLSAGGIGFQPISLHLWNRLPADFFERRLISITKPLSIDPASVEATTAS